MGYTTTKTTTQHIYKTIRDGSLIIGARTWTDTTTTTGGLRGSGNITKYVDATIIHERGWLRTPFLLVFWGILAEFFIPALLYVVVSLMGISFPVLPAYSLYTIAVMLYGNVYLSRSMFRWSLRICGTLSGC
jgi:hypothetical protein